MRRASRSCSRKSESGSTILEAMVALAVLTLLGIGAWNAVGASLLLAGRIGDRVESCSRMLRLDDTLRELAHRVRPPFWAPGDLVEITDRQLSVPWFDGDPARNLLVTFHEGTLELHGGEETTRFAGFQAATFTAAAHGQGRQFGITLRLKGRNGESVTITARFGGTPLVGTAAQ